jgi:hypothetical protein
MSKLAIIVNEKLTLEYDRNKPLEQDQLEYLDKLDAKFDQGIELQGEHIDKPDIQQRARYMTLSMMEGIMYREDAKAAVSVAWLATRLPELKQVVAVVDNEGTQFELVFDREYKPHQVVNFDGLNS